MDLTILGGTFVITAIVLATIRGWDDGKLHRTNSTLDGIVWLIAILLLTFGAQFVLIGAIDNGI